MSNLIETSENINLSIPIIGGKILSIIISENVTIYNIYDLLRVKYNISGKKRIDESILFLFITGLIELNNIKFKVIYED